MSIKKGCCMVYGPAGKQALDLKFGHEMIDPTDRTLFDHMVQTARLIEVPELLGNHQDAVTLGRRATMVRAASIDLARGFSASTCNPARSAAVVVL